jgi:hypothetical protein
MIQRLEQQIADQQRQLEEKDRQMRLQQKEEVHRRFKQMEHRIVRTSICI